ncbi:MAG: FHA domain-containing protein, partial [Actinomycetota bacterium]
MSSGDAPEFVIYVDGVRLPIALSVSEDQVIGRGSGAAVEVDDPRVSRRHAVLRLGEDGWTFSDESRSGSFVDGVPVSVVPVSAGLGIRLADPVAGPLLTFGTLAPTGVEVAPAVTEVGVVVRIGRSSDNDIVLSDLSASRYHAELRRSAST